MQVSFNLVANVQYYIMLGEGQGVNWNIGFPGEKDDTTLQQK